MVVGTRMLESSSLVVLAHCITHSRCLAPPLSLMFHSFLDIHVLEGRRPPQLVARPVSDRMQSGGSAFFDYDELDELTAIDQPHEQQSEPEAEYSDMAEQASPTSEHESDQEPLGPRDREQLPQLPDAGTTLAIQHRPIEFLDSFKEILEVISSDVEVVTSGEWAERMQNVMGMATDIVDGAFKTAHPAAFFHRKGIGNLWNKSVDIDPGA